MGALLAFQAARILELRLAQEALLQYTKITLRAAETSAAELSAAVHLFGNDGVTFCSDEEIAAMRSFVYNAAIIRDLGRERDGMLYCTSVLGRLPQPLHMPVPVFTFFSTLQSAQVEVFPRQRLAIAPSSTGIILAIRGLTAVVNPAVFSGLDSPPMHATGLVRDPGQQRVIPLFGREDVLSSQEVLAQRMIERGGIFYQPLCSPVYAVCVVASEARADMVGRHHGYFISFPVTSVVFSTVGAVLGISIAGCILLYFHRQRSFDRRLRRAVRMRQITCAYQPVVELATYAVVGAEALARWTDESGEVIPPDVFIPVAEEKGLIVALTCLVVDQVLDDMYYLLTGSGFQVAINLSTTDLSDARFFAHLERALKRSRVPPRSLAFEITERATALGGEAQAGIARLRAAGHCVYVDDFGTGYSSLSYLNDLHADAIKIDRVFTRTVGTEAVTASVVPQIIDMASKLKLEIVVEGIETAEQAAYFRRACPGARGQGWLFGRPVAAQEFKVQLRMRSRSSAQEPRASDSSLPAGEPEK